MRMQEPVLLIILLANYVCVLLGLLLVMAPPPPTETNPGAECEDEPIPTAAPPLLQVAPSGLVPGQFAPPLATAEETALIRSTLVMLTDIISSDAQRRSVIELELLRHVRAIGPKATAKTLAESMRRAWARRQKNRDAAIDRGAGAWFDHQRDNRASSWPAASELMHGEWAVGFVKIGLNCGRTLDGCPVKIERIGMYDTDAIFNEPFGLERLKEFYHTLLESQAEALNVDSIAAGRCLRAYEIFDLKGIRLSQVNLSTLRFARGMLSTFAMCYPETTCKAVVVNMPRLMVGPLRTLLEVLPARVRAKVSILGADYHQVLADELDEDALRLISAPHEEVVSHRAPRL